MLVFTDSVARVSPRCTSRKRDGCTRASHFTWRMTITRSGRIGQLLVKAQTMKRLVRKRTHDVEHEALKLVLNSRELKESHRKIAFIQQRQLQRQQHVQKLLANGLRLGQLEHELVYLEEQDEVLKKQANITNILPSIL